MDEITGKEPESGHDTNLAAGARAPDGPDDAKAQIRWNSARHLASRPVIAGQRAVSGVGWKAEEDSPGPVRMLPARRVPLPLPMPAVMQLPDWRALVGWPAPKVSESSARLQPSPGAASIREADGSGPQAQTSAESAAEASRDHRQASDDELELEAVFADGLDDMEADTVETVATEADVDDRTVEAAVPRPHAPMPAEQRAAASPPSDEEDWADDDDETLEELANWLEEDA